VKYLISKSNITNAELSARIEYIYEVFNIYTLKDNSNSNSNITTLNSIPTNCIDLMVIIGHDITTDNYIKDNYKKITENNIVIIACNTGCFSNLSLLSEKNVYLPKNKKIINCYTGEKFGFKFNITDEEILLYRNKNKKLNEVLESYFDKTVIGAYEDMPQNNMKGANIGII
jgi:hypothetical protein